MKIFLCQWGPRILLMGTREGTKCKFQFFVRVEIRMMNATSSLSEIILVFVLISKQDYTFSCALKFKK